MTRQQSIVGCLLGTAVGDAIGLPAEGIPRDRLARLYPKLGGHRLLFGRGMVSDDTEHACVTAQALIASGGDPTLFSRDLARRLRLWLLCLPAGTGLATAKAIARLWLGFGPERSGVWSAGNGPAMRAPIIGVCFGHDPDRMRELVRASTHMTHTDPRAEHGALAVALAAHVASLEAPIGAGAYLSALQAMLPDDAELVGLARAAAESAAKGQMTAEFAESIGQGKGVSGYINATVPVVLHAWFTNPGDYRTAITDVVACGGDTDTTAAILGGIIGASVGVEGIPREWLDGLIEWPRTVGWMRKLGAQLGDVAESGASQRPMGLPVAGVVLRNVLFFLVVLGHGFRRMLPPYYAAWCLLLQ